MKCWLYMIRCKNGALYTGISIDYLQRWWQHYSGTGARYVKNNGFSKPVFLQSFPNKSAAMREENFFKKQEKMWKEEMIKSTLNLLNKEPDKPLLEWHKREWKGKPPWL